MQINRKSSINKHGGNVPPKIKLASVTAGVGGLQPSQVVDGTGPTGKQDQLGRWSI